MAAGMGITPMDVVFSFDTTGSMSQALDEVKARIMDITQKLQADIPGVRVGIIAHGDYCDAEHFYDIRFQDLTDDITCLVGFLNGTDGTGGGDVPECYELALQQAKNMGWRTVGRRILVMIGDAYPHEPDYPMNVQKIDWRNELNDLIAMNVHIYGVQVQNDELSTQFFNKLATASEGQHLQLANMGRVCEVIMGICYREQGPIMFQNYEAEMRHKEPEKFGPDLECAFGTLRHEVSRTSDITTILDQDANESDTDGMSDDDDDGIALNRRLRPKVLRFSDNEDDDDDDDIKGNGKSKLKCLRFSQVFREDDEEEDDDDDVVRGNRKPKLKRLRTVDLVEADVVPTKKTKIESRDSSQKKTKKIVCASRKHTKQQTLTSKTVTTPRSRRSPCNNGRKRFREHVSHCNFKFEPCAWSPWHMAACPTGETRSVKNGKWKHLGHDNSMWRTDLFNGIPATRGCSVMFEMALQAPGSHKRKVVTYHLAKGIQGRGVLALPWYRGVFRRLRPTVNEAVSKDCKIFLRWTRVKSRHLKKCQRVVQQYNYAWKAQPPRLCY